MNKDIIIIKVEIGCFAHTLNIAAQKVGINLEIGCFAHTLNIAAQKAGEVMRPVAKKMRSAVGYIHHSHLPVQIIRDN